MVSSSFRSTLREKKGHVLGTSFRVNLTSRLSSTSLIHLFSSHGERGVEPLLEGAAALENGGQQEVEQGPELGELVLQRGACEQHTPRGQVVRVQDLRQFTVVVLHTMTLVHDHVLPAELLGVKISHIRSQLMNAVQSATNLLHFHNLHQHFGSVFVK